MLEGTLPAFPVARGPGKGNEALCYIPRTGLHCGFGKPGSWKHIFLADHSNENFKALIFASCYFSFKSVFRHAHSQF